MKNIHTIFTFLAIFLSSDINANKYFEKVGRLADDIHRNLPPQVQEFPYKTSVPARVLSQVFYNDKELAARYVKHAEFYAKKGNDRTWIFDNSIDHIVYPFVDTAVGLGMNKINETGVGHALTENISKDNRKFLANNVQLVTSAGVIKLIRIESEKGLSNITNEDGNNFVRSCIAQVGCDFADEYMVKPTVDAIVGVDSWTGWGLRGATNYFLASYIIDKASKY
jgi:hypothetical protein